MSEDSKEEFIQVAIRCRPLSTREKDVNQNKLLNIQTDNKTAKQIITIKHPPPSLEAETKNETTKPDFILTEIDNIFNETAIQTSVFQRTASPIVDSLLKGYNGTIGVYGQTGSGYVIFI